MTARRVFRWTTEAQKAFEELQALLQNSTVLRLPTPTCKSGRPFTLTCDASNVAVSAILSQPDEQDHEHPCAFYSRQLITAEQNYGISERELLAIVFGTERARVYLLEQAFTVISDHQSLQYLLKLRAPTGRLARWLVHLQQFSFILKFKKGRTIAHVDGLTRLRFAEEQIAVLEGVAPAALPLEGTRPEQTMRTTSRSVLAMTRGAEAARRASAQQQQQPAAAQVEGEAREQQQRGAQAAREQQQQEPAAKSVQGATKERRTVESAELRQLQLTLEAELRDLARQTILGTPKKHATNSPPKVRFSRRSMAGYRSTAGIARRGTRTLGGKQIPDQN